MKTLKLGTRKSLLAMAQSRQVARAIEAANPGVKVELVGITTRGDEIQNVPLNQIEGKDFFVKEIDQALLSGAVDLTVHSMKDLSLERPSAITLACVPPRQNSRDIVIFGPGVIEKLAKGEPLQIGTSSPRRLQLLPDFLRQALPNFGKEASLNFRPIRGNINTRLGKLRGAARLDAVVLAVAGLNRLYADKEGKQALSPLLADTRFMIMPLDACPAAPAQGALAIECRRDDASTLDLCKQLHCEPSQVQVARERQMMDEFGGGCHQRYGITGVDHPHLGSVLYAAGIAMDGELVDQVRWKIPAKPNDVQHVFDGGSCKGSIEPLPIRTVSDVNVAFIASPRALPDAYLESVKDAEIYVSGIASWFSLAKRGLWVQGCGEGRGFSGLSEVRRVDFYPLAPQKDWHVFTHLDAGSTWSDGIVVPTYQVKIEPTTAQGDALRKAQHVYWTSGFQYENLSKFVNSDVVHACGVGKTADKLRALELRNLHVFPNRQCWLDWIGHA